MHSSLLLMALSFGLAGSASFGQPERPTTRRVGLLSANVAQADSQPEPEIDHSEHDHGLHFSHPLVAESPSPDTKIRFDYVFQSIAGEEDEGGADRQSFVLEAEYAFAR